MRKLTQPWKLCRSFGIQPVVRVAGPRWPEAGLAAQVTPAPSAYWILREDQGPTAKLAACVLDSCCRPNLSTTSNPKVWNFCTSTPSGVTAQCNPPQFFHSHWKQRGAKKVHTQSLEESNNIFIRRPAINDFIFSASVNWVVRIYSLLLFYFGHPIGAADSVQGGTVESRFTPERLRDFIHNPPNVKNAVFKRTLHLPPVLFSNPDAAKIFLKEIRAGRTNVPAQVELFQLRYQRIPESFIFRELGQPEEQHIQTPPRRQILVGRYNSNWWKIDQRSVVELKSHTGRFTNKLNRVSELYLNQYLMASEILRLGMFELDAASFQLQGDKKNEFTGNSDQGIKINGLLTVNADDVVTSIEYSLERDPRIRKIKFSYLNRNSMGLPDQIDVYSMNRKDGSPTTQHYCTFDVDTWEIDKSNLQSKFFDPHTYASTNDVWMEIVNGEFFVNEGGTNRVHISSSSTHPLVRDVSTRVFRFVMVIGVVGGGLALALSAIKSNKKRSHNEFGSTLVIK